MGDVECKRESRRGDCSSRGRCSTYRSEIINEDTPLMDGQSNRSQSDGIDGFGTLIPQREHGKGVKIVRREREIKCVCARTGLSKQHSVATAQRGNGRGRRVEGTRRGEIVCGTAWQRQRAARRDS